MTKKIYIWNVVKIELESAIILQIFSDQHLKIIFSNMQYFNFSNEYLPTNSIT